MCVYKKVNGSTILFLVLYANDIFIIKNDISNLHSMKDWLSKCFSIKDQRKKSLFST